MRGENMSEAVKKKMLPVIGKALDNKVSPQIKLIIMDSLKTHPMGACCGTAQSGSGHVWNEPE